MPPPKRTIRVALWTAEELSHLGAKAYHWIHPKNDDKRGETYYFVSDCDGGIYAPWNKNATMWTRIGDSGILGEMERISGFLTDNGIPISITNGSKSFLGDVEPWAKEGVPGFFYVNLPSLERYFNYHHTRADTMEAFSPRDIDVVAALHASYAWALANFNI